MEHDNKFYKPLNIASRLLGFCHGESWELEGHIRSFVFGISESVITMRAFYDLEPDDDFDACMDVLALEIIRQAGGTRLLAKVGLQGRVYYNTYSLKDGKTSTEIIDHSFPNGVFFRVECDGKNDELMTDRMAFKEFLGAEIRGLIQKDSAHPIVFFNGESCDIE